MIGRGAWVGTFPDERACQAACAACLTVALAMIAAAVLSWLKGK